MEKGAMDKAEGSSGGGKILIVDDEHSIRRFLRAALSAEGYTVLEAGGGQEGISLCASHRPEAVILDLGLPDGDGLQVIQTLREWSSVPILVLSVRSREADKISALNLGADDYLTKPFGAGELLARLRAIRRRMAGPQETAVVTTGEVVIDLVRRQVTKAGQELRLTATEYELLKALAVNAGMVLTHQQLLRAVWGPGSEGDTHLLQVNISNLRRKLAGESPEASVIVTEPGVGYRLRLVAPGTGEGHASAPDLGTG